MFLIISIYSAFFHPEFPPQGGRSKVEIRNPIESNHERFCFKILQERNVCTLDTKEAMVTQSLKLNNILFLTFTCVKM